MCLTQKIYFEHIKRPRLAIVRFSNGPDDSKTEQNGRHFVFLPFKIRTLKCSVLGWRSVFQVRYSSPHCILFNLLILWGGGKCDFGAFVSVLGPKSQKVK